VTARRVTVFASSSPRTPRTYLAQAEALGRLCAARGWVSVTGAGNSGCMGAFHDACLAAGGRIEGVILQRFLDDGLGHDGLHEVLIAEEMRERKRLLGHRCDAYVVLPGGPGTWEEFWECAVERQIDVHRRPLVLINHRGFYDGFLTQARRAAEEGFLYGELEELFSVVEDADAAVSSLDRAFASSA